MQRLLRELGVTRIIPIPLTWLGCEGKDIGFFTIQRKVNLDLSPIIHVVLEGDVQKVQAPDAECLIPLMDRRIS